MLKLWQLYFLKRFLSVLFLLLVCIFILFTIVDYASHTNAFQFHQIRFSLKELAYYYACEFANHFDILLPLALLIATIKTLTTLNASNELTALMVSGMSLRQLMRPFIAIGLIATALLYVNTQYIMPQTLTSRKILFEKKKNTNSVHKISAVQHVTLTDGTDVLFHHYDTIEGRIADAYWVRSASDIYHMNYLYMTESPPRGIEVDHLLRNTSGQLVVSENSPVRTFPEMKVNRKKLNDELAVPEELSLSELWKRISQSRGINSEKAAVAAADFYFKLAIPWLCLFAIIAPVPVCTAHSRNLPLFMIYATSLVLFVAFFLLLKAFLLLGQRQVLSAPLAIGIPFTIFGLIVGWRYSKY